jgi:hypothetical protein
MRRCCIKIWYPTPEDCEVGHKFLAYGFKNGIYVKKVRALLVAQNGKPFTGVRVKDPDPNMWGFIFEAPRRGIYWLLVYDLGHQDEYDCVAVRVRGRYLTFISPGATAAPTFYASGSSANNGRPSGYLDNPAGPFQGQYIQNGPSWILKFTNCSTGGHTIYVTVPDLTGNPDDTGNKTFTIVPPG